MKKIQRPKNRPNVDSRTYDDLLAGQVEADFSELEKELAQYFREGKNTVTKIDRDLRQRLLLLLLVAEGKKDLQHPVERVIPNAKGQSIDALCSAARFSNFCLIRLANNLNDQAAECIWDMAAEISE